LEPMGWYVLW